VHHQQGSGSGAGCPNDGTGTRILIIEARRTHLCFTHTADDAAEPVDPNAGEKSGTLRC
jgi:hypothetical protein